MQALHLPSWVDSSKDKSIRKVLRLRYILITLALHHSERGSMRSFATRVGLAHNTLSHYIRLGSFSPTAAAQIEKALGQKVIKAEYLIDPLSMPKK